MFDDKARSFVVIMITIALVALSVRFTVEFLLKNFKAQNEVNAQETLRLFSTAFENYARDHAGMFPSNLTVLTQSRPAYIDKGYLEQPYAKGYGYLCDRMEAAGYRCTASPSSCGFTGTKQFTVTTGGSVTVEECSE
jgi:hypothetical protein